MTSSPLPLQNLNELPEAEEKEIDYHRMSELEKASELLYKLRKNFLFYFDNCYMKMERKWNKIFFKVFWSFGTFLNKSRRPHTNLVPGSYVQ
jgi:hypothetical protein